MSVENSINPIESINRSNPQIEGLPVKPVQNNGNHELQVLSNLHAELQKTGSCNMELYNQTIAKLLKK